MKIDRNKNIIPNSKIVSIAFTSPLNLDQNEVRWVGGGGGWGLNHRNIYKRNSYEADNWGGR